MFDNQKVIVIKMCQDDVCYCKYVIFDVPLQKLKTIALWKKESEHVMY